MDERRFDAFHFAAAAVNGVELASEDEGMAAPKRLHERLSASAGS